MKLEVSDDEERKNLGRAWAEWFKFEIHLNKERVSALYMKKEVTYVCK